ncbi:Predicted flavoprotein CzcO associated with the cation diffusion facilitator CzcD [Rhizobiales bacterium GAS191]|nr:Predicted flavoprotein CzcO associated with the cation diffusion facilitator CzcD [Rhizobiales bacterium GAS191]
MVSSGSLRSSSSRTPEYDFMIIGAGVCGLYQLYRLRELGVKVTVLEAHDGLGGTWYRNRYPGCRFDSESYTYAYSCSEELLQEWNWTERFAAQPETLRYLNYFADKFNLRSHIQLNSKVVAATYDEANRLWAVRLEDGRESTTRFLMTAMGLLSQPTLPRFEGRDSFQGLSFHTYDWPAEGVQLEGKRVAVVGTGATGVQVISTIADKVKELTVFQRRPNWCAPLRNSPIDEAEMEQIKRSYDDIFDRCYRSPSGFIHAPDPRKTFEVATEERLAFWEELYSSPGFGIWLGNFKDTLMAEAPNAALSAFMAEKIRARVADPKLAEKLIPNDHGFGTRRVPLETGYYEVYNRPNVRLVDLTETPVERVIPTGIRTTNREYEFDIIVYATGFDAVTGPFDRIEFIGAGGVRLRDKWRDGPVTSFGLQTTGFPNLLTLVGPQSGSVAANFPRGIEDIVGWMTDFAEFLDKNGYTLVEPTPEAERDWVQHVAEINSKVLFGKQKSWFTGHNSNLDRDDKPRQMIYTGGAVRYRRRLVEEAEKGYPSFTLRRSEELEPVGA